jgi:uncharacterized cupredoxin-like copper-binding protein
MPTVDQQKPAAPVQDHPDTGSPPPQPPSPGVPRVVVAIGLFIAAALAVVGIVVFAGGNDESGSDATTPATNATAPAQTAKAPATPAAPAGQVGVTLKEFTLTPAPATAAAGKVTFKVRNTGAVQHEFVVLRTPKPASSLLKGDEASEAGNVGEIGEVRPGATKTLRLNLRAGHYALICNLPGHYKAGQYADLVVK